MDNYRLRATILKLQDRLTDTDREGLHFLLGDDIPRRIRDDLSPNGTLNLIESLIDQDKINEQDLTLLINAFEKISCFDASRLLKEYLKQNQLIESMTDHYSSMPTTLNELSLHQVGEDSRTKVYQRTDRQLDSRKQDSLRMEVSESHQFVEKLPNHRLTKFQFVVIDITKRLDYVARAMFKSLCSMTEKSMFIIDDRSVIDFDELPEKMTLLFVSSECAATMKTRPKQIQAMFILEGDKNKVDHWKRFGSSVDIIFQLADEIYRCYKEEAKECLEAGDLIISKTKEELANQIHSELKKVYNSVLKEQNTRLTPIDTKTTVVWLQLKSQRNNQMEEMRRLLSAFISSFLAFDNQSICEKYLLKNKSTGIVYLIVNSNDKISIGTDIEQQSYMKIVYYCEETSSSHNETLITQYNDLCFQLISDLAVHYNKLGSLYSAKHDATTAKDMFMKTSELYNILAKL